MFDLVTPDTFWLTIVNLMLGVVCVACVVLVTSAAIRDIRERRSAAPDRSPADSHAFFVPGLGETMADGGEPYSEEAPPV